MLTKTFKIWPKKKRPLKFDYEKKNFDSERETNITLYSEKIT